MSAMSGSDSIGANTRSGNILAGEQFEFLAQPSIVRLYATTPIVGQEFDFNVGGEQVINAGDVPNAARYPTRNQDLVVEHGGLPGERLFLSISNTTGIAAVTQWIVDVLPV